MAIINERQTFSFNAERSSDEREQRCVEHYSTVRV